MRSPKNKYLKLPEYPGGKEAFRKYIKDNLIYPKEALEKQVQGIVYINAEVDDNGNIKDVVIEKGLGAACNKEAIRLITNVQFGSVKNRRKRVKIRKKFKIEFKLPLQKELNYQLVNKVEKQRKLPSTKKYSYTIQISKK